MSKNKPLTIKFDEWTTALAEACPASSTLDALNADGFYSTGQLSEFLGLKNTAMRGRIKKLKKLGRIETKTLYVKELRNISNVYRIKK